MMNNRDFIAKRAAAYFKPGDVVNLGIGIPSLCGSYAVSGVLFQSENGFIGIGPKAEGLMVNERYANAGGVNFVPVPGSSAFDVAASFCVIRSGRLAATVLGTLATIGINSMSRRTQLIVNNISYVPVVNPEIITGVSLMLLFVLLQRAGLGGEGGIFGWFTLLVAHITFNVPYVIFNVSPKLRQLDPSLYNAAQDLGCTPRQAFFKVILPQLTPAILSAFLICLTYSIDDFMISYFNCGTMQTLPIAIYSMTRKKVSPEINALSAIMFLIILAIILVSNALDSRTYRKNQAAIRKSMAQA